MFRPIVLPTDPATLNCLLLKFWARVDKNGPIPSHVPNLGRCWLWTGATRGDLGHGCFVVAPAGVFEAHRVSWVIRHGRDVPIGKLVLHKCDNPICIRPFHLFLGSYKDNSRDMVLKGRQNNVSQVGEKNTNSRLTEDHVREIRRLCTEKNHTHRAIAKMFNVGPENVSAILYRRNWKHVV